MDAGELNDLNSNLVPPGGVGRVGQLAEAQTRDTLNAARLNLDAQRLAQTTRNDTQRTSLEQERVLLMKTQQLATLSAQRMVVETAQRQAASAATAYQKLTTIDPTSTDYQKQMLTIKANHTDLTNDKMFTSTVSKLDTENSTHLQQTQALANNTAEEQQKADAAKSLADLKENSPSNLLKTSDTIKTTLSGLVGWQKQLTTDGKPVPQSLVDSIHNLGEANKSLSYHAMQTAEAAAGGGTAPVMPPPAAPVVPTAPITPAIPAATPPPAPVATATPNPNDIVNAYLSGAKPAPVASGLPDDAEKEVAGPNKTD